MSDVISFRLNKGNPREEMALLVLQAWIDKGYTLRQILTESLLKIEDPGSGFGNECFIRELIEKPNRVSQQLEQWGDAGYLPMMMVNGGNIADGLSDSFIQSIKEAARPGVKFAN